LLADRDLNGDVVPRIAVLCFKRANAFLSRSISRIMISIFLADLDISLG